MPVNKIAKKKKVVWAFRDQVASVEKEVPFTASGTAPAEAFSSCIYMPSDCGHSSRQQGSLHNAIVFTRGGTIACTWTGSTTDDLSFAATKDPKLPSGTLGFIDDTIFRMLEDEMTSTAIEIEDEFFADLASVCRKSAEFLATACTLTNAGKIDEAIDCVIDHFETALQDGDIELCEVSLESAKVAAIQVPDVLLAMLAMTLVERERIHTRALFYSRVRNHLRKTYSSSEVEELLSGLR